MFICTITLSCVATFDLQNCCNSFLQILNKTLNLDLGYYLPFL